MSFRDILRSLRKTLPASKAPLLDPLEAYQLWAPSYDNGQGNALLFAEEKAVRRHLESSLIKSKDVLDAGCGTGRNLRLLQEFQPRTIAGIDLSPNMIEKAKGKISGVVSLEVAPIDQLPFNDETFDFILCALVLGHVPEVDAAFMELTRVLRRGGIMFITDFHPFGQLLGWQRTFQGKRDNRSATFAVKYHAHLYSEYFDSFQSNGLELLWMDEPLIDESLLPFYEGAGRADIYEQYKGYPMLLIFQVCKK